MRRAWHLRREATPAEAKLWEYLRRNQLNGVGFRRQHPIGQYITDFCAPSRKLVVELDGREHLRQGAEDSERTEFLESEGFRVLRFWNNQVMGDIERVLMEIQRATRTE